MKLEHTYDQYLRELRGDSPRGVEAREEAYLLLKLLMKQDFGYDAAAWEAWLLENHAGFRKWREFTAKYLKRLNNSE
jgi:hypothetical protein